MNPLLNPVQNLSGSSSQNLAGKKERFLILAKKYCKYSAPS